MLVKPPFAAYLLPPLAWSAWLALRAPDRGPRLRRLAFAPARGRLVAGAAVVRPAARGTAHADPQSLLQAGHRVSAHAELERAPLLSPDLRAAVRPLGGLPRSCGASGRCGTCPAPARLVWSALLPLAIFVLIQNKNLRYALPLASRRRARRRGRGRRAGPRRRGAAMAPPASSSARCRCRWPHSAAAASPSTRVFLLPLVVLGPPGDARTGGTAEMLAAVLRETAGAAGPRGGGAERQLLLGLELPLRGVARRGCPSASSAPGTSRPSASTSPS